MPDSNIEQFKSAIRWHGEYADGCYYGYIHEVLFYTIKQPSNGLYIVAGLPSLVEHEANSLEAAKTACDVNLKAFLRKSGLRAAS